MSIVQNWRRMQRRRRAQIAFTYLHEQRSEHIARYPQLACLAFDHVSLVVNIHGRMDSDFLGWFLDEFSARIANTVALDVGANIGNHALAFADHVERVIAFEPQPLIFDLLKLNAEMRHNIEVRNLGASDRAASLQGAVCREARGSTRITDEIGPNELPVTLDVRPLDEMIHPDENQIGLIKIDVEGHEEQVLRGAVGTIERCRPILIMEQDASVIANGTSPAVDLLRQMGYEIFEPAKRRASFEEGRGIIARSRRVLTHLLQGYPEENWSLTRLAQLESKVYPWLIGLPREAPAMSQ